MNKTLNIVSFDVPYPPNYGGAIDVFYKIKALNNLGINIILHTYEYGRGKQKELEKYCNSIHYYKRKIKLKDFFSRKPFIVKTRTNKKLIENLRSNNFPILFEGLHSTSPLLTANFNNRTVIIRAHNIEHNYYKGLSKSESNIFKKLFFNTEAIKLRPFQKIFKKANYILSISPSEQEYFSVKFPLKSIYIPAFHEHKTVKSMQGSGKFAIYHGDIRVADNTKACFYLVKAFSNTTYPFIIASNFNNPKLESEIKKHSNISFIMLKSNDELTELLKSAHVNILPTFQGTGIKLKLINALFNGRFCLVNDEMIKNTGLEKLCSIANSKKEFINKFEQLSQQEFTENDIIKRTNVLKSFDTHINAQKIIELLN